MQAKLHLVSTTDVRADRAFELQRHVRALRRVVDETGRPISSSLLLQNCDEATERDLARELPDYVRTLRAPGRLPLSTARNIILQDVLAEAGDDDVVAFPDDDGWHTPFGASLVAGLFERDGDLEFLFSRYGPDPIESGDPTITPSPDLRTTLKYASSNTIFVRGRLARRIGLFDERLGVGTPHGGGEDTEYAIRAWHMASSRAFIEAVLVGHRDYLPHLRSTYYRGSLAALAKHRAAGSAAKAQLLRKLAVGLYMAARREMRLRDWWIATSKALAPS